MKLTTDQTIAGTKTFNNQISMGTNLVPTLADHVANKKYVDDNCVKLTTDQTIAGTKTFSNVINASAGIDMKSQSITDVNLVDGDDVSALDTAVVKLTGDQTIGGNKTFTLGLTANDKITTAIDKPIIIGKSTKGTAATGGLELYGADGKINGPHIQAITSFDAYPIFYQHNWGHDNIALSLDAYFDGTNWKSGLTGSNFQIYKNSNKLDFNY